MTLQLSGLHHITAVTGDAPRNVAFYTQVLGMRLVKKTVNQDDVSAYHLFYGDAAATPAPSSPSSTGPTPEPTARHRHHRRHRPPRPLHRLPRALGQRLESTASPTAQ